MSGKTPVLGASPEPGPAATTRPAGTWLRSWDWIWPCLILLIVGAGLRWSTFNLGAQRYHRIAASRFAYSDVVIFFRAQNPLPYLERPLEYPPLTGLVLWLSGLAPGGKQGYFLTSAILLSAALLATFVLLRQAGPGVRLPYFAAAPGIAFYSTLNWDALAVVALTAAIVATRRGRFLLAGVALALGASAKLFPAYVLPVLLAHTLVVTAGPLRPTDWRAILARLRGRAPRHLLGGFVLTLLAVNLPVALLTPSGWLYHLRFHAGRTRNIDSIWQVLPAIPDRAQSLIFALTFLGGIALLTAHVLRGANWESAALLSLLCFLLPTKVYSPQYDLWLLPLLALLAPPLRLWLAFVAADAFYYWAIFRLYAFDGLALLNASIWVRTLALLLLFVWAARRLYGERAAQDTSRVGQGEDEPRNQAPHLAPALPVVRLPRPDL